MVDDPWRDWLSQTVFPNREASPHELWIEQDLEQLVRAADRQRLHVEPVTERFGRMWATFRQHHVCLDERGKYRRRRWMVWRAAALKVMHDRGMYQDSVDERLLLVQLAQAMRFHGPINWDGSFDGGNFWRPSDHDPFGEYAAMVLSLVRASGDRR
jgi:hypothetical protein